MRPFTVLHLETTDVCQAACPLCARETDSEFNKNIKHHLSIPQILNHFNIDQLSKLNKVFACGNYGDPAAGKFTLEIFNWMRDINPTVTLGMNTNGAIRNPVWWNNLALTFNQLNDYVVFSIDGLADTNHLYRVGVSWDKLIENVSAYISAGGSAHWDMLVYKHNQHQVQEAEELARTLGFSWFRAKVSKRPLIGNLQFPDRWTKTTDQETTIKCHVLEEQSFYIDAQGRLHPCCWLGSRQSNFVTDFNKIQKSWNTKTPNETCVKTCGVTNKQTKFSNQWQHVVKLK